MKKPFSLLFTFALLISGKLFGQLAVNLALTPTQMVQNIVGPGVTFANATYTGGANSRGGFTNGSTTNLGLNNGVLLSTTNATTIANPQTTFLNVNLGLGGDADLNVINGGVATFDASVLEFDFVPVSDTVRFRYVFGSEEYPNYVCSHFQDVFAFFVSGPNPAGGNYVKYNVALIPGTAIPVSVNSVNNGNPGGAYSAAGCTSLSYSAYYVDNVAVNGTTIAFGGFTVPLTAWCHVTPCQTYHIKLAVADGFNGLYDSGVFIEANSFTSNTCSTQTSYSNPSLGNNAVEGCSEGVFSFVLAHPTSAPYTINYTIGGTAVNGVEYAAIPASVTIPAGQDSATVVISPFANGITQGTQTVILTYTIDCITKSDTIYIVDNVPIVPTITGNTSICSGTSTTLSVSSIGGTPPVSYSWSNGMGTGTSVTVSPLTPTTYTVMATDFCGATYTSQATVTVDPAINALIASSTNVLCNGQGNGTATATVAGGTPAYTYSWNTIPVQNTASATGLAAGSYSVTVTDSYGCSTVQGVVISQPPSLTASIVSAINSTSCTLPNGSASVTTNGGTGTYSYSWNTYGQNRSHSHRPYRRQLYGNSYRCFGMHSRTNSCPSSTFHYYLRHCSTCQCKMQWR